MDYCIPCRRFPVAEAFTASAVKSEGDPKREIKLRFGGRIGRWNDRISIRTVSTATASPEPSDCGYKSVEDWPLEPRSSAGKFLSIVLHNQRHLFDVSVAEQLNELAADRDGAIARKQHSEGTPEYFLHRRISELKEQECQIVVEDVMYMLIVQKFYEINVNMVPRICRCINHGRVEGWPTKVKELMSIHSVEVLEMVMEHVATIHSWRGKSYVTENWINKTTIQLERLQLGRIYAASVIYGYFLKSACLRHNLDQRLDLTNRDLPLGHGTHVPLAEFQHHRLENLIALGHSTNTKATSLFQVSGRNSRMQEKLKYYVMRFDPETLQRCAKLKSQEAFNIIENHSWALFGDEMGTLKNDEAIDITFACLERLVLEAVAFGSFLWDVEGYVNSVYRLKEN